MQISEEELAVLGLKLPPGRYSSELVGNQIEIYKHGGDTEGCILVGTGRTKGGVSNSRYAMSLLMDELEAMRGKDVWIEIV